MSVPVELALLQMASNPRGEDRLEAACAELAAAAASGARVCVLPELFRSPYFCQDMDVAPFALAEAVPGPSTARLGEVAARHGIVIVASLFEIAAPGVYYNSCAVIDADGRYLGKYRKAHIPNDPLYAEKFYFTPGDSGFRVFETRHARLGVLVCWDQWFPEAARLVALAGAEIVVYPTAIGTIDSEPPEEHARQLDAWRTVQRGHAIANGLFVAAVNRVGREGGIDFWGHSFLVGPQGEMLAEASGDAPETLVVPCALERIREVRDIWPFFRDRRIDAYAGLERRLIEDEDEDGGDAS